MIAGYSPEKIRNDFPALESGTIYFDNACMSLKPQQVLDAMNAYYLSFPSCGGRSSHRWARKVDEAVAEARTKVKSFLNARSPEEIVFTRNTTESINLVARGLPLHKGDEVLISDKEHNSNLIPWLRLVKEKGIVLTLVPSNPDTTFSIESFKQKLHAKTKLVSIVHSSNLDGVINPLEDITRLAHACGAQVLIDAAQSASHRPLDVRALGCDFLALSGHKMLGPTGTGVLYGTKEALNQLTPLVSGGGTVLSSTYTGFTEEQGPARFEAGLQDYAGIIGLGVACTYLKKIGFAAIETHEQKLTQLAIKALTQEPAIEIIGPQDATQRMSIVSFNIKGLDPLNVAQMFAAHNIAVRGGMHCVHSWFNAHNLKGSVRASFSLYNTIDEVQAFLEVMRNIIALI